MWSRSDRFERNLRVYPQRLNLTWQLCKWQYFSRLVGYIFMPSMFRLKQRRISVIVCELHVVCLYTYMYACASLSLSLSPFLYPPGMEPCALIQSV